jgi:hypothetical protein
MQMENSVASRKIDVKLSYRIKKNVMMHFKLIKVYTVNRNGKIRLGNQRASKEQGCQVLRKLLRHLNENLPLIEENTQLTKIFKKYYTCPLFLAFYFALTI